MRPKSVMPVEGGGVTTRYRGALVIADKPRERERIGLARVERKVSAQHHVVNTNYLNQMTKVECLKNHRVVEELLHVMAGRMIGDPRPGLWPDLPGVVGSGAVEGETPTSVKQNQLESGMLLEESTEDHAGRRHQRLQRIPHTIDQEVVRKSLALGVTTGVENHGDCFGLHRGPERVETGLVEIVPVDVPSYLKAVEPEIIDCAVHLGDGEIDVLKRHCRTERNEPIRIFCRHVGKVVVLNPRRLGGGATGGPVEVLGDKYGTTLEVDPHAIHVLDSGGRVGQTVADRGEHDFVVLDGVLAHEVVVVLILTATMGLDRRATGEGRQVAMDVDRYLGPRALPGRGSGIMTPDYEGSRFS